ncbi:hypothetical protein BRC76_06790 [Halobacteriales archaeon QH_8_67_36]|nr:MAG: hypothetical protein BRC76_06790 [Halobacteriales archaeon QH_8_67_36]
MTSLTSVPAHATATAPPPEGRQKTSLFCPSCGHESPITGDWDVEQTADGRAYRCPCCHTVISSRPEN